MAEFGYQLVEDVAKELYIRALKTLPRVELVTAGFPCQDLSQAGRTQGINGKKSGVVEQVFRLVGKRRTRLSRAALKLRDDGHALM